MRAPPSLLVAALSLALIRGAAAGLPLFGAGRRLRGWDLPAVRTQDE